MNRTVKIIVRNKFLEFTTLWLEPWSEDYGMLVKDEFEIIAKNIDADFYFQVDVGKDILVWANGQVIDIGVYQNGELLACGHNREFVIN